MRNEKLGIRKEKSLYYFLIPYLIFLIPYYTFPSATFKITSL